MINHLGTPRRVLSAFFPLILLTGAASAEIAVEHLRLMDMTLVEIRAEGEKNDFDGTTLGHVSIRCSIISSTMAETLPITIPAEADEATRAQVSKIVETYSDNSVQFLERAWGILELPEAQFMELQTEIFNYWSTATAQAAAQLFQKNPEDSDTAQVARLFKEELDICNYLDQQDS